MGKMSVMSGKAQLEGRPTSLVSGRAMPRAKKMSHCGTAQRQHSSQLQHGELSSPPSHAPASHTSRAVWERPSGPLTCMQTALSYIHAARQAKQPSCKSMADPRPSSPGAQTRAASRAADPAGSCAAVGRCCERSSRSAGCQSLPPSSGPGRLCKPQATEATWLAASQQPPVIAAHWHINATGTDAAGKMLARVHEARLLASRRLAFTSRRHLVRMQHVVPLYRFERHRTHAHLCTCEPREVVIQLKRLRRDGIFGRFGCAAQPSDACWGACRQRHCVLHLCVC